jgi:RNA polymerase primary sigma factor
VREYDGYKDALAHKFLTRSEEKAMLIMYAALRDKHGKDHPSTIKIRNRFIVHNLRMVAKMARRYTARMSFEDLMGEGVQGLVTAVERFEVERGYRFCTMAQQWVRHSLQRAVMDRAYTVRVPVHRQEKLKNGVLEIDGVKIGRIQYSLDAKIGDDESGTLYDVLHDEEARGAESDLSDMRGAADVRRAMYRVLNAREREIIERRYLRGDEETLLEVGQYVGNLSGEPCSRERIRQLQEVALAKLRKELSKHAPEARKVAL